MERAKKGLKLVLILGLISIGMWLWWRTTRSGTTERETLVFHGNVERKEIRLSLEVGGEVKEVYVEEGDEVEKGTPLLSVDEEPYENALKIAEANLEAARLTLQLLKKGARKEEIERAEANVRAAKAKYENAKKRYERAKSLASSDATAIQNLDDARTNLQIAKANLEAARLTLQLLKKGARKEEIERAEANVKAAEAQVAESERKLRKTLLTSPCSGVVECLLCEVGETAVPFKPVIVLIPIHEKKVRFFVSEKELPAVKPGSTAKIETDSGEVVMGKVCFVSSEAEFTPQNVETEEVRPTLVYTAKVCVKDPENVLRAGMPVTVVLENHHE